MLPQACNHKKLKISYFKAKKCLLSKVLSKLSKKVFYGGNPKETMNIQKDSEKFSEETMPIGIEHLNLLHQDQVHLVEHLLKHLLHKPKGKETETERGEELFNNL